ncbi:hypothetical protein AOLI_G00038360 [Acnodon oligacanthus]
MDIVAGLLAPVDFATPLFPPIPHLPVSAAVRVQPAPLVLQHVVRVHGSPSDLVSDRGPQFASRFWKAFCQLMGASVSLSSGFHPESNGQTERVNQDLTRTLRCLTSTNPSSWAEHLPWAEYAHNTLRHSSLRMSPFKCRFGFPPPMFPGEERKIDQLVNPVSYWLHLLPSMRGHSTLHVSCFRPFLCGTRPPAPRYVAGSPAYTIRRLLDSCRVRGGVQYLVDWEGYGPEERSWVPASHILDPDLVREFQQARNGELGTSGASSLGSERVQEEDQTADAPWDSVWIELNEAKPHAIEICLII